MLFIDMETAAMVKQNIPTGARGYPVCAGAAGCLINWKVQSASNTFVQRIIPFVATYKYALPWM